MVTEEPPVMFRYAAPLSLAMPLPTLPLMVTGGPGKVDDGAGVAVNAVSGAADDAQGAAGYVEACAGIDYNAVLSSGSVPVMAAGHVGQAHGTAGKLQAHAIGNAEAVGKAECKGTAEAEILAESIPLGPGGGAVGQQDDGLPAAASAMAASMVSKLTSVPSRTILAT